MLEQREESASGGWSDDIVCLAVSPFPLSASLMVAVGQNCLQMYAAAVNMALNDISARQDEALRALKSAAMLSLWPLSYLANSAVVVEPERILPEQRISATVINFPDRRKTAT